MQTKLLIYCQELIQTTKDEKLLRRLHIIEEILKVPDCFVHLSIDTAINMLLDLGYTKDEALKIYEYEIQKKKN